MNGVIIGNQRQNGEGTVCEWPGLIEGTGTKPTKPMELNEWNVNQPELK